MAHRNKKNVALHFELRDHFFHTKKTHVSDVLTKKIMKIHVYIYN